MIIVAAQEGQVVAARRKYRFRSGLSYGFSVPFARLTARTPELATFGPRSSGEVALLTRRPGTQTGLEIFIYSLASLSS